MQSRPLSLTIQQADDHEKWREQQQQEEEEEDEEERRMLAAFSAENRQSAFEWDEYYGRGFNALHMKLVNAPA